MYNITDRGYRRGSDRLVTSSRALGVNLSGDGDNRVRVWECSCFIGCNCVVTCRVNRHNLWFCGRYVGALEVSGAFRGHGGRSVGGYRGHGTEATA